jgi:hypothetical protein
MDMSCYLFQNLYNLLDRKRIPENLFARNGVLPPHHSFIVNLILITILLIIFYKN